MDYGRVLADAWRLLWRFKALWIFGFITALCNGSGFRGNFNYNFNGSPGGQLPPELDPLFRFLARPGVIISLILIGLVLWVIFALVRAVAEGAMIGMVQEAEEQGNTGFSSGLTVGMRHALSIFVMDIVLALPLLAVGLLALVLVLVPIIGAAVTGVGQGSNRTIGAALAGIFSLICVMVCILLLLSIAISFIRNNALRAIVMDQQGVFGGIGRGWAVFRRHMGEFIILAVILFVIGIAVSIFVGIPIAAFGAVGILPLLEEIARTGTFRVALLIPILATTIVAAIVLAIFEGTLLAYSSTAWTLAYRRLTGRGPVEEPIPAPVSPTPGWS